MHNLSKIRIFRALLCCTYPIALLLVYPLALFKKKNASGLFFFLDRYSIGGAQRIHLDILAASQDIAKQLYFTRVSLDKTLKQEFYSVPKTDARDIHVWCDNLLLRLFTVHYYAFYINRHSKGHVFSSNSTFFYDMLFFINKKIRTTELLHNFTHGKNGMEFFGLANHKYLTNRIVYDTYTLQNIKNQYVKYNIHPLYIERVLFIEPGVNIPPAFSKDLSLPLKVLYAGRGTPQKRIYLLDEIATRCIKNNLNIQFHFAGTMMDELSEFVKQHSIIHGEISEQDKMYDLYKNCHAILMTSAYEGFPMLIKESMACGCVPVVTALEGNKAHLFHNENALLIQQPEDEKNVVDEGIYMLKILANNPFELERLSKAAYSYALVNFDRNKFISTYKAFFNV